MAIESLKKRYDQYSPDSIKKIVYILEKLKEEWDLIPKEPKHYYQWIEHYDYIVPNKKVIKANISHKKFSDWIANAGLSDFYELQNILATLQQEGLISNINFTDEFV